MRALVTNDDGVDALGIRVLARAAVAAGLDVTVAAPHEERSGSGTGLSALQEGGHLVVEPREWDDVEGARVLAVHASPAMIAFVGGHGAFDDTVPDVVLSGVNHGGNAGRAVLHSGTVGAALTAASLGIPALAVSIQGMRPVHWETAAEAARLALEQFLAGPREGYVLNVNVPDVPLDGLRGLRTAPMATLGALRTRIAERTDDYVRLDFHVVDVELEPGSDVALMKEGWATATALRPTFALSDVELPSLA